MLLINAKTGIPEEISDLDIAKEERKAAKRSGSLGFSMSKSSPNRRNSFGAGRSKPSKDDFVSEITRTSDFPKKLRTSQRRPDHKIASADSSGITRTSDDSKNKRPPSDPSAPRTKPTHSSKSYAVFLLSKRDYSASILRTKIVVRGYSEEEADEAMAFVIGHKFQDDERYAGMKARNIEMRAGNAKVLMTLKSKGIDDDLAIAQLHDLSPEDERAVSAASKFKRLIPETGIDLKLKAKIYRFLGSRGFSSRSIRTAMDSLIPGYVDEHFDPNDS